MFLIPKSRFLKICLGTFQTEAKNSNGCNSHNNIFRIPKIHQQMYDLWAFTGNITSIHH